MEKKKSVVRSFLILALIAGLLAAAVSLIAASPTRASVDSLLSPDAPTFETLELIESLDQNTWVLVPGDLASGFEMELCPAETYYYLDVQNVTTNDPLAYDYFGFYLDVNQLPDGFYEFWAAKGVDAGATGWQGHMWQIINGLEPIFYLKVWDDGGSPGYMLVDGLMWSYFSTETFLQVNGDYPEGAYAFDGTIEDEFGVPGDVTVNITFSRNYPEITDLELVYSLDTVTWSPVAGDLASGFEMELCPTVEYYYLDTEDVTATHALTEGLHSFYLDTGQLPAGFYDYWAAKDVDAGATGWQGYMWQIINGLEPMFYLKVWDDGGSPGYTLVDGLMWGYFGTEVFLQLNGDYPEGAYAFNGTITDPCTNQTQMQVGITFVRDYPDITDLELVYSLDTVTWSPVYGDLAGGFILGIDPVVEYYYLDTDDVTVTHAISEGLHSFYLDTNQLPDGFYEYWAAKGVDAGATGWQGHMWQIINGLEPMFYLKVWDDGGSPAYMLVDGLMWGYFSTEAFLQLNGDYPLGAYLFNGTITDPCTNQTQMQVGITFIAAGPAITIAPMAMEEVLPFGETSTRLLDLGNAGLDPLHWEILEVNQGMARRISIPAFGGDLPRSRVPVSFGRAPHSEGIEGEPAGSTNLVLNGSPAYGIKVVDDSMYYWPEIDQPGTWSLVNQLGAGDYFCGDLAGSDLSTLYVIDNVFKILYAIDTATGIPTEIGSSPALSGQTWTGMAWDPSTDVMYGSATDGTTATLFTIDLATGATAEVGTLAGFTYTIDIAVDVTGQMYGVDLGADALIEIDKSTGAGTLVGTLGFDSNYAQGLDFDDDTGILYWAAHGTTPSSGELRAIDTTTGASAPVGAFPGNAEVDAFAIATKGAEVPWLWESPMRGTVPAFESTSVQVTFDARVVPEPGTYLANLDVYSDDPANNPVTVQVTMTVLSGDDLGRLEGIIQSLGYCDVDPAPLGASVSIADDAGMTWQVASDPATGYYYQWLEPGTYTVTASAPEHEPALALVDVTGGLTTTQNLGLRSVESCLGWTPQAFTATLPVGYQRDEILALENDGAGELAWAFEEVAVPWAGVAPTTGLTPPDDVSEVVITFDATSLAPDQCYDTDLGLLHDDPGWTSPVSVPLHLCVEVCIDVTEVRLSVLTDPVYAGSEVAFRANILPDEAAKPYDYSIDYGDGTPPVTGSDSADPLSFAYTYAAPGTYTLEIEVWNCDMTTPVHDSIEVGVLDPLGIRHSYYLPLIVKNN